MWIVALTIGFAGSLHCVTMCSPLSMAVTNMRGTALLNRLLYNGGRIFTYAVIGAILASVGALLPLAPLQNLISIGLGVTLLILGLARFDHIRIPIFTSLVEKLALLIRMQFKYAFSRKTRTSIVLMGMLNGLVPCGLTLLAFTYCISLKGAIDGFNFMILFGLGTLPAMLGITSVLVAFIRRLDLNVRTVNTSLLMISGLLLITRVILFATVEAHETGRDFVDIVMCR